MFNFKTFSLHHQNSTLKIGTDSVLLSSIISLSEITSLLDIGCGCGVIAFCLAYRIKQNSGNKRPNLSCNVVGIDIDEFSVQEALLNSRLFSVNSSFIFDFQQISLQYFSKNCQQKFDLIVSNPPYFSQSLKPDSPCKIISKHRDNTLSFCDLVSSVKKLLSDEGSFWLILPPSSQKEFDFEAFNNLYLKERWEISPTPSKGVHRLVSEYQLKKVDSIIQKKLQIRDKNQQYSDEYKELTKMFYLDF